MGKASSNYRGLKLTVTQSPEGDYALVSLSVKSTGNRWDEWTLVMPALRVPLESAGSLLEVLDVASEACAVAYRAMDG
jgi:hypothetical protein